MRHKRGMATLMVRVVVFRHAGCPWRDKDLWEGGGRDAAAVERAAVRISMSRTERRAGI